MTRQLSRAFVPLLALLFWLSQNSLTLAQSSWAANRVASVVEDTAGNLLLINTVSTTLVNQPFLHYLPGSDGSTVAVADFPGLFWGQPARTIVPSASWVHSIHIGQFQANPPVMRISVSTKEPQHLEELSFQSRPGVLMVRWIKAVEPLQLSRASNQVIPPAAPDYRSGSDMPEGQEEHSATYSAATSPASLKAPEALKLAMPPPAPPWRSKQAAPDRQASTDNSSADNGHVSRWRSAWHHLFGSDKQTADSPGSNAAPEAAQPARSDSKLSHKPTGSSAEHNTTPRQCAGQPSVRLSRNQSSSARQADGRTATLKQSQRYPGQLPTTEPADVSEKMATIPPHLSISGVQPVNLELSSPRPFSYQAFRLHNPERYVLDIHSLPELAQCQAPPVTPGPMLHAIRIGSPGPDLSRIVLDLEGPQVEIKDQIVSTVQTHKLTLSLSETTSQPPRTSKLPTQMLVVIDAGHGGSDPGAQRGDVQEKEITLEIADKVRKLIEDSGIKVVMTRSQDTAVSLESRVAITNTAAADAFLSIHINSLETNSSIHGIETYYQTDQSHQLAQAIHSELVGKLEAPDRNIRKARFYVINHTPIPAVLAEVGFISNKEERSKLISSDYQNQIAGALSSGVILYLSRKAEISGKGSIEATSSKIASSRQTEISPTATSLAALGSSAARVTK